MFDHINFENIVSIDGYLISVGITALSVIAIFFYNKHHLKKDFMTDVFPFIRNTILTVAVFVAGLIYFLERRDMTSVDLDLQIESHYLGENTILIEGFLYVKNVGQRKIDIDEFDARLQQVKPASSAIMSLPDKTNEEYWASLDSADDQYKPDKKNALEINCQFRVKDQSDCLFNKTEIIYPNIWHNNVGRVKIDGNYHSRRRESDVEIEPSEEQVFVSSFVTNCDVEIVRIVNNLNFRVKGLYDEEGNLMRMSWKRRAFEDLRKKCSQDEG